MKIYGDAVSGNCFKIKLLAAILEIPHDWVHVDVVGGGAITEQFLAKNPNGKVPLLELDDGRFLSESNAIIDYLAFGSVLFPDDDFVRAKILQWQFFEQYSHEPYIAVARFIAKFEGLPEHRKAEFDAKQAGGHKALRVMEQQLALTPYIVNDVLTVADIALYAYTHVADEGGFSLSDYPKLRAWLQRVSNHPNYVGMES